MPIAPFSIISYQSNPAFFQIGQQVQLTPSPGFSANSYAISGTLPLGLSFSTSTGYITGTPTTLTPASTLMVTATLANATTTSCYVIVTITDIPATAPIANQNSAADLVNLRLLAEQNFITAANAMILNNNQLGIFEAFFDIPLYASPKTLYNYFTNLGYTFWPVNHESNPYAVYYPTGDFYDIYYPYTSGYPYYTGLGPAYPFIPQNLPRVRISWQATQARCYPYGC